MGSDLGKGRIFILSDHSVFINGMMLQTDNGNFDFAYNCVKWLNDSGKRRNVLFVDEGTIVQDFKVPPQNLPAPPISPVEAVDQVIVALEEHDLLNKLILEQFSLRRIMSGWAIALTVGLLLFGFYRLIRAGYHVDTQVPLVAQSVAQRGPAVAIMEQRRQSLLQDGNLWEAARDVARQWFGEMGYEAWNNSAPPRFHVTAGWWRRLRWQGQVRRLWQLASDPTPRLVPKWEFARLLAQVQDLRTAARDGTLQLQGPRTTA
jgi:hypothetical protein